MGRFSNLSRILPSIDSNPCSGDLAGTQDISEIIVVTRRAEVIRSVIDWILPAHCAVVPRQSLPESWRNSSILLVDLDSYADLETPVETLLKFRVRNPNLPVVLASGEFRRDAADSGRLQIADASLKWPFSAAHLLSLLPEIRENNIIWQKRAAHDP